MALFTVIAAYEVQVSYVATVEIEAEDEKSAQEIAETMNQDGELPWQEESAGKLISKESLWHIIYLRRK